MKTLFAIGFLLFICWMYFVSRRSKTELAELVGSGFVVTAMDSVPEQQIAFDGINKKIAFLGVRVPYPDNSNPISYYRVSLIALSSITVKLQEFQFICVGHLHIRTSITNPIILKLAPK